MRRPTLRGIIDRQILVNFRVDAVVLERLLPPPFRPRLIRGIGMADVCLMRLKRLRPKFLPQACGLTSENAIHRIAVNWERDGELCPGVYVTRSDTSSRLTSLMYRTLFNGAAHHASFAVKEEFDRYCISFESDDEQAHVAVDGHLTPELTETSVFRSVREATEFFACEAFEDAHHAFRLPNVQDFQVHSPKWRLQPLDVRRAESSFFDEPQRFPPGSVEFDSALLVQEVEPLWDRQAVLCSEPAV